MELSTLPLVTNGIDLCLLMSLWQPLAYQTTYFPLKSGNRLLLQTSAGTPTVAEDRGSPEITGRPIGDPKAASKPSGDSLAGEGRKGLDVLRGGRIRGLRRSMDSGAEALCEAWANLPDGGASLQKLHEAVAEVSALHRQLSPPGHDSGSSAALHKLLQVWPLLHPSHLSAILRTNPPAAPASLPRPSTPPWASLLLLLFR